ncbi:nucleoside 2-deoxyribosyltransferase [Ensifer adhaerens]|uniref:nucleoside 2-deoxyribosyltransferase n=1 Tax=Ensifer adhaerens TaxID=106592 RepID=UPI003D072F07
MRSIYLAGPDVFYPDFEQLVARKAELVRQRGFLPIYAGVMDYPMAPSKWQTGVAISAVNELLMRGADMLIANLTPFRGLAADTGTAFEIGFMSARDRPIYAYSNASAKHTERIIQFYNGERRIDSSGSPRGSDNTLIEDFEMTDNLMIDGTVALRNGRICVPPDGTDLPFDDLTVFEACLNALVLAECGK